MPSHDEAKKAQESAEVLKPDFASMTDDPFSDAERDRLIGLSKDARSWKEFAKKILPLLINAGLKAFV